ncbi:histone-lysine N-methyltransferase SMYD3-like [Montipora foliosa]|uniref:histone-lysine N-methyltransferase SMYD3-like n=1 Tax=Montipora foliosa TaxID=591990 RepID=UPI0035F15B35
MAASEALGKVVEIFKCSESKGYGLRALKPLKPGENVLQSTPSVFVLGSNMRSHCCDFCFAKRDEIQRCSKCKFARYCNRECQKKAWKEHNIECERIREVSPNTPTDLVLLISRIIYKKQMDKTFSAELARLVSHREQFGKAKKDVFSAILAVLVKFIGEKKFRETSPSELFELFGKICCNSFTICDNELQPLGVGVYTTASYLNHSCCPNCAAVFNGTTLIIHATEQVKEGDELTISYTELLCPSYERKEDLMSRYCFECKCIKCTSPLEEDGLMLSAQCFDPGCKGAVPRYSEGGNLASCNTCGKSLIDRSDVVKAESLMVKSKKALKEIEVLDKLGDHKAVFELVEELLAQQNGLFHKLHYVKISLLDKAMDACIYLEMWDTALAYGLQTMDGYKLYYPRNHPVVGIQLFRIGKLQVYLDKLLEGFKSLQQAEAILDVTHGINHPLVTELKEMIARTVEEVRAKGKQTHFNRNLDLVLLKSP